jgi:hypothetical protein
MKRVLIALITALPLAVGVTAAQADGGIAGGLANEAAVAGTVVQVDASTGTFLANASVLTPPSQGAGDSSGDGGGSGPGTGTGGPGFGFGSVFGSGFGSVFGSGSGPGSGSGGGFGGDLRSRDTTTTTQVTITTNSSTMIHVRGMTGTGTVSDLAPGDRFLALFPGSSTDTIQTLVAGPATSIFAQVPKQFYAFVGTVTATDTTAGTLSVNVMRSLPSTLIASGSAATFTVDPRTFIIDGSSLTGGGFGGLFGGSLSGVSKGDMVAGGLIGAAGLTATQVGATPLMFLLDLPAPPATASTGTTAGVARKALRETMKVLHGGKVKLGKSHGGKSHHKKSTHAGKR